MIPIMNLENETKTFDLMSAICHDDLTFSAKIRFHNFEMRLFSLSPSVCVFFFKDFKSAWD